MDAVEPGGDDGIDEGVDPAAGRKHERATPRQERFCRLAVEGHDADIQLLNLRAMTFACRPFMKRNLSRSWVRTGIFGLLAH